MFNLVHLLAAPLPVTSSDKHHHELPLLLIPSGFISQSLWLLIPAYSLWSFNIFPCYTTACLIVHVWVHLHLQTVTVYEKEKAEVKLLYPLYIHTSNSLFQQTHMICDWCTNKYPVYSHPIKLIILVSLQSKCPPSITKSHPWHNLSSLMYQPKIFL